MSERRANDNDPKVKGYELGDLEVVPTRRSSGAHPAVVASQPAPPAVVNASPAPRVAPASASQPLPMKPMRGAPRNLTLADGDIGPALELDVGPAAAAQGRVSTPERRAQPPRAPSPAARAPAAAASVPTVSAEAAVASYGGASVLDDFDDGFAKLPELEVEQVERRSGDRVAAREPVDEARENERKEADEIRTLAGFNDAPDRLLACAQYAVHVALRVFKLRKERAVAIEKQRSAAEHHKAALVALGEALLTNAADKRMEALRSKVAHVHDERAKVQRADQGVERTREGNLRALNLMRSEADHLKEELEPYMAAEKEALAAQRRADEEVRRAEAMRKRVEIELRALEAAAARDEAKVDALHTQLEQREQAFSLLTSGLALANESLGKARRDLALKRGALDLNEEKQKRLEAESRARELEAEGHKNTANGAYQAALCDLSETAQKLKLDALAPEAAAKVQAAAVALEAAGVAVLRFDRALKLYDRKATLHGFALMAGMIALAVAALLLR